MSVAYYNEHEPFAAAWLQALIDDGQIAPGVVDTRDIRDVLPSDLEGFTQCHFFAGIGGWSLALRLAGWPDDRAIWTGSCPCQPFSAAGAGLGFADERHLWPSWHWLIAQCRPAVVIGEQVASAAGRVWFDLVSTDLERLAYAVGASDLCAAGVGAPHIRQRLYWVGVADTDRAGQSADRGAVRSERGHDAGRRGADDGLAHPAPRGQREYRRAPRDTGHADERVETGGLGHATLGGGRPGLRHYGSPEQRRAVAPDAGGDGSHGLEHASRLGWQRREAPTPGHLDDGSPPLGPQGEHGTSLASSHWRATAGFWHPADWILCSDGLARPVEPGTCPLATGVPARMGRLRGYGNSIVPQVGAAFLDAVMQELDQ